jgi:hypothetical protein
MELSDDDVVVLLECVDYSIQRVRDSVGTPHTIRQEKLFLLSRIRAIVAGAGAAALRIGRS